MPKALTSAGIVAAGAALMITASGTTGYTASATTLPGAARGVATHLGTDASCSAKDAQSFSNWNSSKYLEVRHSEKQNGAPVDQWSQNRTYTQYWCPVNVGGFKYELVNLNSGKCLEIYHSETSNGARADAWSCDNTKTQKWEFYNVVEGVYNIVNVNTGKCLEIYHSETFNGARADAWSCNDTKTQEWAPNDAPPRSIEHAVPGSAIKSADKADFRHAGIR